MTLKTHLMALDPNNKQATLLARHCGYARVARNHALSDFKAGLAENEWRSGYTLNVRFNAVKHETYPWCKELDQRAAKNAVMHIDDAVKRWRRGQNRFPRYHTRASRTSYQPHERVRIDRNRVKLPKIGWVRMREKLRWRGEIRRCVVSKRAGRWFLSVLVKVVSDSAPRVRSQRGPMRVVGVDVGIKTLAVTSDGVEFENPKALYRYLRKLRRAQRQLSRSVYRSRNWYRKQFRVQKIHYRICCLREDTHHKASTAIVKSADVLGIESLRVAGLLKNRRLAKALSDASLSGFLTMLRYKAEARGVEIIEAPSNFPSSKTCSACGNKKTKLSLSERTYHCEACGVGIDRDLNAAHNLRNLAASLTERQNGCGATISPHSRHTSCVSEARRIETATTTDKRTGQIRIDVSRLS